MAVCRRRMARRNPICPKPSGVCSLTPRISSQPASRAASITSVLLAPAIVLRRRAESRLATKPIRQPASVTATLKGSHVPAVGSATTRLPAYGLRWAVSCAIPARVGGTRKSSWTPGPRTATWWAATTAASMPIETAPLLQFTTVIEGSPFHPVVAPRPATPANLTGRERP
jgi:hypothetical protein